MKKLLVHYRGWGERWWLGTLADDGRQLLFEYSPVAIEQGLELSPHLLRLRPEAYGPFPLHQHRLPGLIADALPDGWGLRVMDRLLRRQGVDVARLSPLDRLCFIGERAMGALAFEPAMREDWDARERTLVTLAAEAHTFARDAQPAALRDLALLGGSPHGARPKVLVYLPADGGGEDTAAASAPPPKVAVRPTLAHEPWIVKFPAAGEHPEVCALEALYAQMAHRCGLEVPRTRHFVLGRGLAAFGALRFDRIRTRPGDSASDDGGAHRVPMHSLAGLLHADFRVPGSVDATTFLRATRMLTHDEREVSKAFERVVFNVVFHNRDDHARNVSYRLGPDRHWVLAPAYDLTFSAGPGGEHAMDVCGQGREINRAHLMRLAQEGGVRPAEATATIERIAEVAGQLQAEAEQWPLRKATVRALVKAVRVARAHALQGTAGRAAR